MKPNAKKTLFELLYLLIASIGAAFAIYILVEKNKFAPGGVTGITAMLEHLTGIGLEIYAFVINFSLLIVAWFVLKKKYVLYVALYTLISNGIIAILRALDFYQFAAAGERVMPALLSGIILGLMTGLLLAIGASSGGLDTLACMITKKYPNFKIERVISIFCYVVIAVSYFVYGNDLDSVMLAIAHILAYEQGMGFIMSVKRRRDTRLSAAASDIANRTGSAADPLDKLGKAVYNKRAEYS